MRHALFARASAIAVACAFSGAALAEDMPTTDEIVVTAQFREQNILEVPLAVTAYDGEFLDEIGVDEFDQLSNYVPGFVMQEQSVNNPGFVLRGITSDDGAAPVEPRVSVFQNGVSIARSRGSVIQLFDLERIEVLKGPQGTLFGRSAQIGAVHVITKKPVFDYEAGVQAEFGNFGERSIKGYANAPLGDTAAIRIAGAYKKRDGFIENTEGGAALNGTDSYSLRASLRIEPADDLRIDIIGNYAKDTPSGTSFKSGVIPAFGGTTNPNDFASLNTFGNFLGGKPLSVDRDLHDITVIANWKINDDWGVVSTTGYRAFNALEVFDPDGSAMPFTIFAENAHSEQISSDIRFSYDAGKRLTGFFGGGVFAEKPRTSVPLGFNVGEVAALFSSLTAVSDPVDGVAYFGGNPALVPVLLSGDPNVLAYAMGLAGIPAGVYQQESYTNYADNFSYDIFGELSYALTDRLTFTAGGRWTHDNKETKFSSAIDIPNPYTAFIVGAPSLFAGDSNGIISSKAMGVDHKFDGFSWRAVLNYEFSDGNYAYFNYSRGRRPEVVQDDFASNGMGGIYGGFEIVPAETVSSYEAGLKGSFLDGFATVESAVYYYKYDNFQSTVLRDVGTGTPSFETLNAGSATTYGAELGLTLKPTDDLNVFLTYGYNHSRFDDTDSAGNPQIYGGNRFRLSPDHSLSVGMNYRKPLSFATAYLTPTYTWKSSVYFEDENTDQYAVVNPANGATLYTVPAIAQDAFGLLNLRGGLEFKDGRFILEGYAENLLNKDYIIDAGNTGGGFGIPTYIAGAPRYYGGGVKIRF